MDRSLIDELARDMEAAWGEPINERARELYAAALADLEDVACRAALSEFVMKDRDRRPSPGMLRASALSRAATASAGADEVPTRPPVRADAPRSSPAVRKSHALALAAGEAVPDLAVSLARSRRDAAGNVDALSLMSGGRAAVPPPPLPPASAPPGRAPLSATALMAGTPEVDHPDDHTLYLNADQVRGLVKDAMPPVPGVVDGDEFADRAYLAASVGAGTFVGTALAAPASPVRTPTDQLNRAVVDVMIARARTAMLMQLIMREPDRFDTSLLDLVERAEVERGSVTVAPAVARRMLSWFDTQGTDVSDALLPTVSWVLAPLGAAGSLDEALNEIGLNEAQVDALRAVHNEAHAASGAYLGAELAAELNGFYAGAQGLWLTDAFMDAMNIMAGMIRDHIPDTSY